MAQISLLQIPGSSRLLNHPFSEYGEKHHLFISQYLFPLITSLITEKSKWILFSNCFLFQIHTPLLPSLPGSLWFPPPSLLWYLSCLLSPSVMFVSMVTPTSVAQIKGGIRVCLSAKFVEVGQKSVFSSTPLLVKGSMMALRLTNESCAIQNVFACVCDLLRSQERSDALKCGFVAAVVILYPICRLQGLVQIKRLEKRSFNKTKASSHLTSEYLKMILAIRIWWQNHWEFIFSLTLFSSSLMSGGFSWKHWSLLRGGGL